jgi:hypothetical protein
MTDLQRISFEEIKNDGKLTVYQARIGYSDVPGAQVYALTAITSSPRSNVEKAALEEVLNEMRAAFTLQHEPVVGESDDTPEQFDWPNEIVFLPSLISIGHQGPVSVAVTVEGTIGDDEITTGDDEQLRAHVVTLPKYRNHHWHSSSGYKTQATVNVGLGVGTLSPAPNPPNPIGPGPVYKTTGKTVVVHADKRLKYTFGGSFNYPPN